MAVYANRSNTYRGEYHTNGGEGFVENGGSGTTFIQAPNSEGVVESSLFINNQEGKPKSDFITDKTKDSSRTYIVTSEEDTAEDMTFSHVYINGVGHLALLNTSETDVEVRINHLHGDYTGSIHASVDQKLVIEQSDSPFPASFRSYDGSTLELPEGKPSKYRNQPY